MTKQTTVKCHHAWVGFGFCKRTDRPTQTLIFYECTAAGCSALKTEEQSQ